MSLYPATATAPRTRFGERFQTRAPRLPAPASLARTTPGAIDVPRAQAARAPAPIGKPRTVALMVPSRTPKSDSAGAVISGALPSAAMLLGARLADRSSLGQAVKEFSGVAELSDVAAGAAILARATGLDANLPAVRGKATLLIVGKMHEWALRIGDKGADVMTSWAEYNGKKAAKADAAKAEATKTAPAGAAAASAPVQQQAEVASAP